MRECVCHSCGYPCSAVEMKLALWHLTRVCACVGCQLHVSAGLTAPLFDWLTDFQNTSLLTNTSLFDNITPTIVCMSIHVHEPHQLNGAPPLTAGENERKAAALTCLKPRLIQSVTRDHGGCEAAAWIKKRLKCYFTDDRSRPQRGITRCGDP